MNKSLIILVLIGLCITNLSFSGGEESVAPTYKGKALFGIVAAEASNANIPNNYAGVLINANITLYGPNVTLVIKPFLFFPSAIMTNNTVNLYMKFFWGATQIENNTAQLAGWAYGITWEWEE